MRFDRIAVQLFDFFHAAFHGDTEMTFGVCSKCGGVCEKSKVGTLMPGEKEYMATEWCLEPAEFARRYLDVIEMKDGTWLNVLKMVDGCPFLTPKTYECSCRRMKPIMCDIYPVVFAVEPDGVRFFLDDWCPLSEVEGIHRYFTEVAIPLLRELPVPVEWYRLVESYDHLYFDYAEIERVRISHQVCEVFPIARLLEFQNPALGVEPIERWCPKDIKGTP